MQIESKVSEQIEEILGDLTGSNDVVEKHIVLIDDTHLQIEDTLYELVLNYREGFDIEAFKQRYQDYFEKFDFLVGDWGFEQLRLRGFYQINQRHVARDQWIDYLEDYLNEYCNFGCQYFVLAKEGAVQRYNQLLLNKQESAKPTAQVAKSFNKSIHTKSQVKRNKKEKSNSNKASEVFKIKVVEDRKPVSHKKKNLPKPIDNQPQHKRKIEEKNVEKVSKATEAPNNKKGSFVIKQKMK